MQRVVQLRQTLAAVAVALLLAAPTTAALVSPTKSNGTFIAGSGIPADNFTSVTANTGDTVALKGRLRDTGQALSQSGNTYYVPTGLAADNANPAWSFDYQFTPEDGAADPNFFSLTDYWLTLEVDFDPTPGSASFKSVAGPVSSLAPNFYSNPGSGAWSNDVTPWVVSDSANLGFASWFLAPPIGPTGYDPDVVGEYEIRLTVSELAFFGLIPVRGADIAATNIFVQTVPEPATAAMAGVAMLGLLAARRRRAS
jgi:MYXO-CTERM domain-containing protein